MAEAAPFSVLPPLLVGTNGSEIVGVGFIDQQCPCWVGLGTPRLVIFPLPVAVVPEIAVTAWVVTVGLE